MNKKVKVLPVDSIMNNEARKGMANRELEIRFYNEKENILIVNWDGLATILNRDEYEDIE
jgi:hypothetical protein